MNSKTASRPPPKAGGTSTEYLDALSLRKMSSVMLMAPTADIVNTSPVARMRCDTMSDAIPRTVQRCVWWAFIY